MVEGSSKEEEVKTEEPYVAMKEENGSFWTRIIGEGVNPIYDFWRGPFNKEEAEWDRYFMFDSCPGCGQYTGSFMELVLYTRECPNSECKRKV